jgi:hypothetical protein
VFAKHTFEQKKKKHLAKTLPTKQGLKAFDLTGLT